MTLHNVLSMLIAASFLALAGTTWAANPSPVKSQGAIAYQVVQAAPVDCKKHPTDPACKDKKIK